ncbi:MFS transporter [Paenibacillus ihumii]|uniref:MFS transporter n=1 Tax=Paenibacillus ihumii TaxID=687436 RepID=UPI0006D83AD8|nr:MFS transporter [Paenibacillus ihumii]
MQTQSALPREAQAMAEEAPLFKNKVFMLAFLSLILNSLSTSVFLLTESWYIVNYLGKGSSLGIVLMMAAIPRLLLMPIGGVIADRFKKTHIMFLSDASRSILLVIMLVAFQMNTLSLAWMASFALVFGILDAFYWPASQSLIPTVVSENRLAQANSVYQVVQQVFYLTGPLIGGLILTFGTYTTLFGTISIMLLLGGILSLYLGKFLAKEKEGDAAAPSFKQEMLEGLRYVKGQTFIKILMLILIVAGFFLSGPLSVAIPLLVDSVLQGNALTLSYLEISVSVGMILGGAVIALTKLRQRRALISVLSLALCGICLILLGLTSSFLIMMLLLATCGMVLSFSNTFFITLLQERTSTDKIGRVMSLVTTATTGLLPLSHAVISFSMHSGVTISNLLILFGSIVAAYCFLLIYCSKSVRTV